MPSLGREQRQSPARAVGRRHRLAAWRPAAGTADCRTRIQAGLEETAVRQRQDVAAARFGVDLVGRALAARRKTRFFPAGLHAGSAPRATPTGGPRVTGPEWRCSCRSSTPAGLAAAPRSRASARPAPARGSGAHRALRGARGRREVLASRALATSWRDTLLPQRPAHPGVDAAALQLDVRLAPTTCCWRSGAEVEAERAYVDAWRDYWIARAELEAALGGALPGGATSEGEKR